MTSCAWQCALIAYLLLSVQALSQEITEKAVEKPTPAEEAGTVNYSFDENETESDLEVSYYSGIERIFKNPALASGISTGTAAINRSIESLMEAIFYRLLDNELIYEASGTTKFSFALKRDVFNTSTGNYVVVDQFSIGPRYLQKLRDFGKLPVNVKADATSNIYNIYPRSDGQRLAEREDLPYWRVVINNWFGLLPLFTRILPPSFNPNEIYDPLTQLATPFNFPTDPQIFYSMPIGSIRSFSANAGISIPADFANILDQHHRNLLEKFENLTAALPVSVFVSGEHRVSVLRRSENIAWVGLSNVRRTGASVAAEIGRTLKILSKVSQYWKGVDVPFFPLDFNLAKAKAIRFDQLYEFDLRNKYAQEAFRKAVGGDFTLAHQRYLDNREKDIDTGVRFHFNRNQDGIETDDESGTNLFVFRRTRNNSRSHGDVEITDPDGKFFMLETRQESDDEQWEVLTGSEQVASRDIARIRVLKVLDQDKEEGEKYRYIFSATDNDPISITVSLSIQDRHVDAEELEDYLDSIRRFTRMKLAKVPRIPNRDQEKMKEQTYFDAVSDPATHHRRLHVTPTYLGQFNANASVVFSTQVLKEISSKSEDQMWAAFARAFDQSANDWRTSENRGFSTAASAVLKSALMMPLRMVSVRSPWADFYWTAHQAIDALKKLNQAESPGEKLELISQLLASPYSDRTAEALLLLSNIKKVPRSVSFFSRPRGNAPINVKNLFRLLNNQVIRSGAAAPQDSRHKIAEDKLAEFYPSQLKQRGTKPLITEVSVKAKELSPALGAVEPDPVEDDEESGDETKPKGKAKFIQLQLKVKNMNPASDGRFYIRIENAGELQVGRFVIAEQVVEVPAYLSDQMLEPSNPSYQTYRIWLNGFQSPIRTMMTDEAVAFSGNIQVHISASIDGKLWSDERLLRFRFEDGMLMPP